MSLRLHQQRVFGSGDWYYDKPPIRVRVWARLIRTSWAWNECRWAGLGRRCPYYDCDVHGEANRAPLVAAKKTRDAHYHAVLDRTDGVSSAVLTPELFDRACALVYFDGDPRR